MTTVIQAALDDAGVVRLEGSFATSSPLVVYSNTVLDARDATITLTAASSCNMLQTQATEGSGTDENITVVGGIWDRGANGGTGNAAHSMVFRKVSGLTVRDCTFRSTGGKFSMLLMLATDFLVENIYLDDVNSDGVHLQGGCVRGVVRNVQGIAGDDVVGITPLDWTGYTWGDETDITDITVEGIRGSSSAATCIVRANGGAGLSLKRITIRDIKGTPGSHGVWIGNDSSDTNTATGRIDGIRIEDVQVTVADTYNCVRVNPVDGGRITIDGVHWRAGSNTSGSAVYVDNNTVLDSLHVSRLSVEDGLASGSVVKLGTGATVTSMIVDGVTGALASNMQIVSILDSSSTTTITSLTVSNVTVTGTSSGAIVRAATSGQVLSRLFLSNISANNITNVANLNTTTTVFCQNVNMQGGSGFAVGAVGSVVAYVSNSIMGTTTVTSGGGIRSRALGFRVDASLLTKTAGDLAYNTNAGLSCGAGPIVCDGTNWKHLYTGDTY